MIKNVVRVHADSWTSPAESARTVYFAHATANWCRRPPSVVSIYTSNEIMFASVRLGRCGPPKEENGVQHFFLFQYTWYCFSRAALNLFVLYNQSTPTHVAHNIPFDSFQSSLGGKKGACLNSLRGAWERAERAETARGHSFRSYLKERVWVHAECWASPAESVRTVYYSHTTASWCSHPCCVVSIYIK